MSPPDEQASGATVVISHRVRQGQESAYEAWLDRIGPLCRASPGHLDLQILRPIVGLTSTYTVVIRFDTPANLRRWMDSDERRGLITVVRPLLATDDEYTVSHGLDFLFSASGAGAKAPVRWKQFLVTWSAIFPLVLATPLVVSPLMRRLGIPGDSVTTTLLVTGTVVFLMVYLVMPRYTKLLRHWLFR